MRTAVTVVITVALAIMVLVGVFVAADNAWSEGEENVEDTGGFFSDCIGDVLTDSDDADCGLFNENGNGVD